MTQDNSPRTKPLRRGPPQQPPKGKRKKNRVTVRQLIASCAQPLAFGPDQTKAIDEFVAMKYDYQRAAAVHMTIALLQKYIDAAIAAFNEAPVEKKDEVLASSMVLHFRPFELQGLFIGGSISAKSMALFGGWLITVPDVKVDIKLDPPLADGEDRGDDEEDDPDAPPPMLEVPKG